jgi:hypothetical protein
VELDTACRDHYPHAESWQQSGLEAGLELLIEWLSLRVGDAV